MPFSNRLRRTLDFLVEPEKQEREPLTWKSLPSTVTSKEGHMSCHVRTLLECQNIMSKGPRLTRELDIMPDPVSAELVGPIKLHVHERDLRKCNGNLELLKRCDLDRPTTPDGAPRAGTQSRTVSRFSTSGWLPRCAIAVSEFDLRDAIPVSSKSSVDLSGVPISIRSSKSSVELRGGASESERTPQRSASKVLRRRVASLPRVQTV